MKKIIPFFFLITVFCSAFSQQDSDGCKDSPMFPTRMLNYFISECASNFDEANFNLAAGGEKTVRKEGTKTMVHYQFNPESNQTKPSTLQILRNFENAAKKIGGTTVFLSAAEAIATFKVLKNGKETAWVKIECGGNDSSDFYELTIIQLEEMKQEVTSTDILTALNTDGHIALYINFETGKADIKPESQNIIDQISEMMLANPALKISLEGHTDNVGSITSNQTLSESRVKAVMNSLVTKGTDKSRLAAKGWGQTKPITENTSEEGKAKNRRVEIVKL
jgi:outer membrane protein OmpA-like peptidoglycan-associated protein